MDIFITVIFFFYFEGSEVLAGDEQSSLSDEINNKEPTLIETIFAILSDCILSPKSLGIAFEAYMEKEQLWDCLYNMTGTLFISKYSKTAENFTFSDI